MTPFYQGMDSSQRTRDARLPCCADCAKSRIAGRKASDEARPAVFIVLDGAVVARDDVTSRVRRRPRPPFRTDTSTGDRSADIRHHSDCGLALSLDSWPITERADGPMRGKDFVVMHAWTSVRHQGCDTDFLRGHGVAGRALRCVCRRANFSFAKKREGNVAICAQSTVTKARSTSSRPATPRF